MHTPEKNQPTSEELLLKEVAFFAHNADPLLSIDLLTYNMTETIARDGDFTRQEWQCFYYTIRLLTHIARHGSGLS